ncbi:MAG: GNAT family N-acetyltransferase [Pseudomonadales bacterium]
MDSNSQYSISCTPLDEIGALERDWLSLEKRADNRFFTSWGWIGTWLKTYSPECDVLRAYADSELVALGILVRAKERRSLVLRSETIQLNQTGDPAKDQLWIEYNGLLTDKAHHSLVTPACVKYLCDCYPEWDELVVGAVTEDEALLFKNVGGLSRYNMWEAPTFGVDLKAIRTSGVDYLSTLSRNTRYQIRRSIRRYEESGKLRIEFANNVEDALEYFDDISPLHIDRWGEGLGQSGFANPEFVRFHRELIRSVWPLGNIDVCRILIDEQPIAFFYNFIYRDKVYFYLSGLKNESNSALKPGLVGHALCIQSYIDSGRNYYDFMGGGERYKASLGERHQGLCKIRFQKELFKFRIEQQGRTIKHSVLRY